VRSTARPLTHRRCAPDRHIDHAWQPSLVAVADCWDQPVASREFRNGRAIVSVMIVNRSAVGIVSRFRSPERLLRKTCY
jgi:hypothetical protein